MGDSDVEVNTKEIRENHQSNQIQQMNQANRMHQRQQMGQIQQMGQMNMPEAKPILEIANCQWRRIFCFRGECAVFSNGSLVSCPNSKSCRAA